MEFLLVAVRHCSLLCRFAVPDSRHPEGGQPGSAADPLDGKVLVRHPHRHPCCVAGYHGLRVRARGGRDPFADSGFEVVLGPGKRAAGTDFQHPAIAATGPAGTLRRECPRGSAGSCPDLARSHHWGTTDSSERRPGQTARRQLQYAPSSVDYHGPGLCPGRTLALWRRAGHRDRVSRPVLPARIARREYPISWLAHVALHLPHVRQPDFLRHELDQLPGYDQRGHRAAGDWPCPVPLCRYRVGIKTLFSQLLRELASQAIRQKPTRVSPTELLCSCKSSVLLLFDDQSFTGLICGCAAVQLS